MKHSPMPKMTISKKHHNQDKALMAHGRMTVRVGGARLCGICDARIAPGADHYVTVEHGPVCLAHKEAA